MLYVKVTKTLQPNIIMLLAIINEHVAINFNFSYLHPAFMSPRITPLLLL